MKKQRNQRYKITALWKNGNQWVYDVDGWLEVVKTARHLMQKDWIVSVVISAYDRDDHREGA